MNRIQFTHGCLHFIICRYGYLLFVVTTPDSRSNHVTAQWAVLNKRCAILDSWKRLVVILLMKTEAEDGCQRNTFCFISLVCGECSLITVNIFFQKF